MGNFCGKKAATAKKYGTPSDAQAQAEPADGNVRVRSTSAAAALHDAATAAEAAAARKRLLEPIPAHVQAWYDAEPGEPPEGVDRKSAEAMGKAIAPCIGWLVDCAESAHLDKDIKEAGRRLLRAKKFTTSLTRAKKFKSFAKLTGDLHKHLVLLGAPLAALFNAGKLGEVLSDARLGACVKYHPLFDPAAADAAAAEVSAAALHPWLRTALDYTDLGAMPEHVATHIMVMLTVAVNARFEASCAALAARAGLPRAAVVLPGCKAFARMLNKTASSDDYYSKPSPRAAFNADTCRAMVALPKAEDVLALVALAGEFFLGCAKFKNVFGLSEAERMERFHLCTAMLSVVFDTGLTFAELRADPAVVAAWDAHAKWCPDGTQPQERWALHAGQARAILEGGAIAGLRVVWLCELQIILDPFKAVRHTMHEPYKLMRAPTPMALYDDVARTLAPAAVDRSQDEEEVRRVFTAAKRGRAATLGRLLAAGKGGVVEDGGSDLGATALYAASEKGHTDAVAVLLAHGANVNATEKASDATPLYVATSKGHFDTMKLLIQVGRADVDLARDGGGTPLYRAATKGFADAARILLAAGADPNKALDGGTTPLIMAAEKGFAEVVELLLAHNADKAAVTNNGNTAHKKAAKHGKFSADLMERLKA